MHKLQKATAVPLKHVKIDDAFWLQYIQLVREMVLPYQWDALNDRVLDAEPSHAVKNFKIAAGDEQGEEEFPSLAYVPPEPEDDTQLNYALDLIRGLNVNSPYPPDPDGAVPN